MKNQPLTLFDATVHPGERASLALPLPEIYTCAPMYMPIKVVHGNEPGPTLLVTAAMHGNEVNGTAIIKKLLSDDKLKNMKGTLIAIPVLNVYGMVHRSRYMPDGSVLDSCFPGSQSGSHGSRLAHMFSSEILGKTDYCIDLQTGPLNHSNLPQIFTIVEDEKCLELAYAFGAPVISESENQEKSLQATCIHNKIPLLTYEAGEAMRFDQQAIDTGLSGIFEVMKSIDMLSNAEQPSDEIHYEPMVAQDVLRIRSPKSGIAMSHVAMGQKINKKQNIATIHDPFGAGDDVDLPSAYSGVIVSINNQPLVHEGEVLFHLAITSELAEAESTIQEWQELQEHKEEDAS